MDEIKGTATCLARRQSRGGADQRMFKLDPPLKDWDWDSSGEEMTAFEYEYVIVSAVDVEDRPSMTTVFAAREPGNWNPRSYHDLPGSFTGAKDPDRALRSLGYEVHYPATEQQS